MIGLGATGVRPGSLVIFPEFLYPHVRLNYRERVSTGAWVRGAGARVLLPASNAGLMNRRHHMIQ